MQLQKDFLRLIERDAEVFEPLSKAYGMPRETEEEKAEKARVMEIVLKDACSVPMEIMEKCCEAIELIVEFAAKGSKLWQSAMQVLVQLSVKQHYRVQASMFTSTQNPWQTESMQKN